eukprot:1160804-Pelagomonas_calceolata.AAC.24
MSSKLKAGWQSGLPGPRPALFSCKQKYNQDQKRRTDVWRANEKAKSSINMHREPEKEMAPDAWDVAPAEEAQPLFCGFPEGSPDRRGYSIGNVLGKGGFGNVFSVKSESVI